MAGGQERQFSIEASERQDINTTVGRVYDVFELSEGQRVLADQMVSAFASVICAGIKAATEMSFPTLPDSLLYEEKHLEKLTPIGEVVNKWRNKRKLRVKDLAVRCKITGGYISQLEHGKISHPGDDRLSLLAEGLGIPVENLITRVLPQDTDQEE